MFAVRSLHILSALLLFTFATCLLTSCSAQTPAMQAAMTASRQSPAMSAKIVLTWRTGGVTRQTTGTVTLSKPNLARIVLHGEYPEVLLLADGHTRYLAPDEDHFQKSALDPNGVGIDSPWWGLPFRFFFTQSVNPFGAQPDTTATYREVTPRPGEDIKLHRVVAQGDSPMGAYTESLLFKATGDLVESSVQFGEGPGAALFEARLTDIRHDRLAVEAFRFTPNARQVSVGTADHMLPLGAHAPNFILPTPDGKTISLAQELEGRRAVLVNFWYYNCAPCRIEFPEFEALYRQFATQGLSIVAVNKGDSAKVVSRYIGAAGLTFSVALGGQATSNSVFAKYKVGDAFPGTYLLDRNGKVVYRSAGEDLPGLKEALAQLGLK